MQENSQAEFGFYHGKIWLRLFKCPAQILTFVLYREPQAWSNDVFCGYHALMRHKILFLWNATRGHRLTPWRSPYLLWRIETYTGVKMKQIGFLEFWEFMWRERADLWRFLKWTGDMDRYVHPKPRNS